jgi:hypothetical protein
MLKQIARFATCLIPAAETMLLLALVLGGPLTRCIPWWTDEVHYWNEINSFRAAGFRCGYHTIEEYPAPALFSHFGPHGPVFPLVLGSIARVTGWGLAGVPVFNAIFISLSLAGYLVLIRGARPNLIAMAAVLSTFWPLLLYVPVTMQETLQQGLGVLLAGLLVSGIRDPASIRPSRAIAGVSIVAFAALLRPTWSLLAVASATTVRPSRIRIALALCGVVAAFVAFSWLASPYPSFFQELLHQLKEAPLGGLGTLAHHAAGNLRALFRLDGNVLELLLLGQCVFLTIWSGTSLWFSANQVQWRLLAFHALNIGSILVLAILFYDLHEYRAYRVLAGPLLVSILVAVGLEQHRLVVIFVASNLLFVASFLTVYKTSHYSQFHADPRRIEAAAVAFGDTLRFEPELSPWCNTILWVSPAPWPVEVLGVPAGVGVAITSNPFVLQRPLRSRYIVVDNAVTLQGTHAPLIQLTHLRNGTLYQNSAANCTP